MNSKRMTALVNYSNGGIGWPEGMSPNWPAGETRIIPDNLYEAILRDGAGKFEVQHYHPEPPVTIDLTDGVQPEEASAAGAALAAYAEQQHTDPTEPAAVEGAAPKKRKPRKTADKE